MIKSNGYIKRNPLSFLLSLVIFVIIYLSYAMLHSLALKSACLSRKCTLKQNPKSLIKAWKFRMSHVLMEGSFYPYRCVRVRPSVLQFGLAVRWTQSGTIAARGRIQNRHLLCPRLPCIAQVTASRHTTVTGAEAARDARPHLPRSTIGADPRETTRHYRTDVSAVEAAHDRLRCVLTDGPDPTTRTGSAIVTENDHENTREETDRGRDHAADRAPGADPVRETKDEVAVTIAAEIGIDTGRVEGITIEHLRTNRTL